MSDKNRRDDTHDKGRGDANNSNGTKAELEADKEEERRRLWIKCWERSD